MAIKFKLVELISGLAMLVALIFIISIKYGPSIPTPILWAAGVSLLVGIFAFWFWYFVFRETDREGGSYTAPEAHALPIL